MAAYSVPTRTPRLGGNTKVHRLLLPGEAPPSVARSPLVLLSPVSPPSFLPCSPLAHPPLHHQHLSPHQQAEPSAPCIAQGAWAPRDKPVGSQTGEASRPRNASSPLPIQLGDVTSPLTPCQGDAGEARREARFSAPDDGGACRVDFFLY